MRKREQHGYTNTSTYTTWQDMLSRCENKNNVRYKNYGGRGIKVCEAWRSSFLTFLKDMGERPEKKTIDRINNDLGYYKENCKWSDYFEQNRNTRHNRKITINGETRCLIDWVKDYKIKYNTVLYRIIRGWSPEKAIKTKCQI